MKLTTQMERRAARAMKRAAHEGCDPRNTTMQQAKVYKRMWTDEQRRKARKVKAWSMGDALNIWDVEGDLR